MRVRARLQALMILPIRHIPAADWPTVAERVAAARRHAGTSAAEAAEAIDATETELLAFEAGDPVLGVYDLQLLADLLGTTTGAWFCGDERPLFRSTDKAACEEAARIGAGLMARHLASEAAAG